MIESLKQLDRDIFVYLNGLGMEKYDGLWVFVTQVSNWIPLVILFFILIFHFYKRKQALTVIVYLLVVVALTVSITARSEEHTSELQSRPHLVCRLLLEKKK